MKTLIINTHLMYPGWSEGKLNLTLMNLATDFFVERGHQVTETFVERGYNPEEEVDKHVAADLVILQTPVNWFGAPWIYKKYVDEVFNVGLARKVFLEGDGRTRSDSRNVTSRPPSHSRVRSGRRSGLPIRVTAITGAAAPFTINVPV